MANFVSATFAATGQSAEIEGSKFDIAMNFAGTASVDIERKMPDGDWIKIETAITADYNQEAEFVLPVVLRLNCTAHTNDVEYFMQATKVRD